MEDLITISLVQKHGCESLRSVTTGNTSLLSRFVKKNKIGLTCLVLSATWGYGLAILTSGTPHILNTLSYPNSTKMVRGTHTVFFVTYPKRLCQRMSMGTSICLTTDGVSDISRSLRLEIKLPRLATLQSTLPKTSTIRLLNEDGEVSTIPEDWQNAERLHVTLYQTLFRRLGSQPIAALRGGIMTVTMSDWHTGSMKYEQDEIPLSTASSMRVKMNEQTPLLRSHDGECGEQLTFYGKESR